MGETGGSGGGSNGGSGGGGYNKPDDDNNDNNPWFWGRTIAVVVCSGALLNCQPRVDFLPTETSPVSIIVPALNEENGITETLAYLKSLDPAPDQIIVVDGGSTDNTVKVAKKAGATTVVQSKRGRGRQMNEGAKKVKVNATAESKISKEFKNSVAAPLSILMFVHSDSRPPQDAILRARKTLADPRIVLGGFFTTIEHQDRILLFTTFHQFISTYYAPLLFAPVAFTRGLKCMFGDQSLFCRAEDFWRAGGFNNKLPIMEDADLCVRMHRKGLASGKPGREVQLNTCVNRTSGRRIGPWGNWQTTKIQLKLSLAWWKGASPDEMWRLYDKWYTDAFR